MSRRSTHALLALALIGPACATRVGNPPKPAAIALPIVDELIPAKPALANAPANGFPGAGGFLDSFAASTPRHRELLKGLNAIARQLEAMGLELGVSNTQFVGGVEVKAIVREDAGVENGRKAVVCAAGKPFYQLAWRDGADGLGARVDLQNDPFQAFAALAAEDRRFVASLGLAKTPERVELDLVLDGRPRDNDPFVDELGRVLERARYRTRSADSQIVYQGTQLWYEGTLPDLRTPQITLAGLLAADGGHVYAIHHSEAKLVCPAPLDRANAAAPGWCVGYRGAADGSSGLFTPAAEAQATWAGIKDDGLVDPATTLPPSLDGVCPE